MLSVRHVLDGHRLYDEVRVAYGPSYYLEKWLVHGALDVPLTHAAVRSTTAASRLTTAMLAAVTPAGLTRNLPLGALTFLLVHHSPRRLLDEPGHPQELGVLLAMALPLCGVAARRRPALSLFGLGCLVAALFMVKINLGAFGGMAVVSALAATMGSNALRPVLRAGSVLAALVLPQLVGRLSAHNGRRSPAWSRPGARPGAMIVPADG
jgi:hypothetical protein